MKIALIQAFAANKKLQKRQYPDGQPKKPPLLNAKGDAGVAIYFLKHAIQDAFKSHFERIQDLRKEQVDLLQNTRKTRPAFQIKTASD